VAPGPIKDQFKDYIGSTSVAVKEGGLFSETERVFSDTKLYISPLRSWLGVDIVEAMECLLRWNRAGLQEETE
jgi:hypothetical protein